MVIVEKREKFTNIMPLVTVFSITGNMKMPQKDNIVQVGVLLHQANVDTRDGHVMETVGSNDMLTNVMDPIIVTTTITGIILTVLPILHALEVHV